MTNSENLQLFASSSNEKNSPTETQYIDNIKIGQILMSSYNCYSLLFCAPFFVQKHAFRSSRFFGKQSHERALCEDILATSRISALVIGALARRFADSLVSLVFSIEFLS